jgi:excisionase family DNA binding protein
MSKKSVKTAPVVAADAPAIIPKLLTPVEAAKASGIGKTKLLELVRAGRLPCRMFDGRIRIKADDLAAFVDGLPSGYEKQAIPENLHR